MSRYNNNRYIWIWGIAVILIAGAAIRIYLHVAGEFDAVFAGFDRRGVDEWGQRGDYMGGILNPLFSLLSFILLLITILIQSVELRMTRQEMRQARLAQEKVARAQEEEADAQEQNNRLEVGKQRLQRIQAKIAICEQQLDSLPTLPLSPERKEEMQVEVWNVLSKLAGELHAKGEVSALELILDESELISTSVVEEGSRETP